MTCLPPPGKASPSSRQGATGYSSIFLKIRGFEVILAEVDVHF